MTEPNKPAAKEALSNHFCAYNDGEQTCDCFIAGFNAASDQMYKENKLMREWIQKRDCMCGKDFDCQRCKILSSLSPHGK